MTSNKKDMPTGLQVILEVAVLVVLCCGCAISPVLEQDRRSLDSSSFYWNCSVLGHDIFEATKSGLLLRVEKFSVWLCSTCGLFVSARKFSHFFFKLKLIMKLIEVYFFMLHSIIFFSFSRATVLSDRGTERKTQIFIVRRCMYVSNPWSTVCKKSHG